VEKYSTALILFLVKIKITHISKLFLSTYSYGFIVTNKIDKFISVPNFMDFVNINTVKESRHLYGELP
jgi:hypothetical protein